MSIALAIALVGMTSLAVALLLLPLLLDRARPATRDAYNLAVYRDQLAELERDISRGLLSPEQAGAARAEIGRRIIALAPADLDGSAATRTLAHPRPVAAAAAAILAMPVGALLIYAALGSPALPDQPFAERAHGEAPAVAGNPGHTDLQTALGQLRAHLAAHPDDLPGWLLLARSDVGLGQYQAAADAYGRAADLSGRRADVMGDWGEAQVLAAGGSVTVAAAAAFTAALTDPAAAPRSRYYLALAQLQHGDAAGALQAWRALERDSPADAAWLPVLRQRIAEATARLAPATSPGATAPNGGMPSAATVAAGEQAMATASPEQRRAMIDTMVGRLAARLAQHPDDVDGWTRLARSYAVLGEPVKAREAYARALKLKPDDPALKADLADASNAAAAGKPGVSLPPAASPPR